MTSRKYLKKFSRAYNSNIFISDQKAEYKQVRFPRQQPYELQSCMFHWFLHWQQRKNCARSHRGICSWDLLSIETFITWVILKSISHLISYSVWLRYNSRLVNSHIQFIEVHNIYIAHVSPRVIRCLSITHLSSTVFSNQGFGTLSDTWNEVNAEYLVDLSRPLDIRNILEVFNRIITTDISTLKLEIWLHNYFVAITEAEC